MLIEGWLKEEEYSGWNVQRTEGGRSCDKKGEDKRKEGEGAESWSLFALPFHHRSITREGPSSINHVLQRRVNRTDLINLIICGEGERRHSNRRENNFSRKDFSVLPISELPVRSTLKLSVREYLLVWREIPRVNVERSGIQILWKFPRVSCHVCPVKTISINFSPWIQINVPYPIFIFFRF